MEQQVKLFTREELKCRNTRDDAILIIHNGVYDVTKFLDEVSLRSKDILIINFIQISILLLYYGIQLCKSVKYLE